MSPTRAVSPANVRQQIRDVSARPVRHDRFPVLSAPNSSVAVRAGLHDPRRCRKHKTWTWSEVRRLLRNDQDRHPLRHEVVEFDTTWSGVSLDVLLARRRRSTTKFSPRGATAGPQSSARGSHRRQGVGRILIRRKPSSLTRRSARCSFRACTSGRARSGFAASSCFVTMRPAGK
jgi:hypothetical protein